MNNKIKFLIIFFIIAIVSICGILVMQKSDKNVTTSPQIQEETEAPQAKIVKPEVPQKPVTKDESDIPKSDYNVPEIG